MAKHYKYKQYKESDSRDSKGCNDLRKPFNATERQYAKKECEEGVKEIPKHMIEDLRYTVEIDMANECYQKKKDCLALGTEHVCTCTDPSGWSDEKVLAYYGITKGE